MKTGPEYDCKETESRGEQVSKAVNVGLAKRTLMDGWMDRRESTGMNRDVSEIPNSLINNCASVHIIREEMSESAPMEKERKKGRKQNTSAVQ
ncbi:hypothetical protein ACLOJK_019969 [Asimina triloba]